MGSRIERELALLQEGGQKTALISGRRGNDTISCVIYFDVPTGGADKDLPTTTDVIVPVPNGYAASAIDLAGLPAGSPLLGRVKGCINTHGSIDTEQRQWRLVSYHPHSGGGAPPWNQMVHGFHTYLTELIVWLDKIS